MNQLVPDRSSLLCSSPIVHASITIYIEFMPEKE
jgi:hypothetical protein